MAVASVFGPAASEKQIFFEKNIVPRKKQVEKYGL
jgi:hypothetical protein